jgi:hypothetical protein
MLGASWQADKSGESPGTVQPTSQPSLVPEGQLLRPNDWSIAAAWVLFTIAVSAGLFLLLRPPATPHSELTGSYRLILGFLWIGFGLMAVSKVRSGVTVEKDGILVRSRIGSSRYRWSQISEFKWQPSAIRKALQIHLKDGRCIYAHGFSVRSPAEAQRAKEMVAELNRLAAGGSTE